MRDYTAFATPFFNNIAPFRPLAARMSNSKVGRLAAGLIHGTDRTRIRGRQLRAGGLSETERAMLMGGACTKAYGRSPMPWSGGKSFAPRINETQYRALRGAASSPAKLPRRVLRGNLANVG
jgi:hypothetical protein